MRSKALFQVESPPRLDIGHPLRRLRYLRDIEHWKWDEIVKFQKWSRTGFGLLVRQIRDEW